ncbi:GBF-interacting protein 1 [Arabidopsis thaliana x Arabidopsis arenosa]|uniref:GBF-interacting protein 1 n=1 Tax=Arabidopsis thaliana x Arabidopsis arenosa TaxID=1240361 RepID=A0A8T2CEC1_9BRAS|nr:GBF-interacting protein 1 [Arabidopsis thaliana x Arabidopsis arenosa]
MSSSDGGSSRVSIPYRLRKTLQSIREITGKQHSDEDIFAVYKDSFNDPYETAQKLLFLDTFHEVRSKREKKKENIVPVTQASGRGGRRNFSSSNSYQGNGRNASFKRENGANHVTRGSRTALPVTNKASNITVPNEIKVSGPTSVPSEVSNHKVQDDPSLIPASRCSSQSDRATEIETASKQGKTQLVPKSDVSEQSHVTFPFHLQVAKGLQNGLTFGSFDSNFVKEVSSNNGSSGGDNSNFESSDGTGDDEREPSPTANGIPGVASAREEASTFSEDKDYGISNSAPGAEPVVHSDHIVPSVEEVLKEEALSNTETHQIAPLSVFGLVSSLSAIGQPVNTEAAETQPGNSNSPAISLVSYPPDQSSIAAASQQANFLRQQYPPNFFPYGPYYSPYYMPPPYIHQFLSPNGIPQQSFFPPGAALTAPSHVNPVGNTENPPTTNPYLNASPMVASSIPSATTLNSIHSEEKASPLTESAAAWIGQGFGNLQVNPMYNLAFQGQPVGFPLVQAGHGGLMGIHQPTQPMAAASTTYQTLPPPPHTTTAMGEPIGHPHIAYQQPQAALTNWVNNY